MLTSESKKKKIKAGDSETMKKAYSDFEGSRKIVNKNKEQVWRWWEEKTKEDGVKWNTLQHWGPVFAPAYERVPSNVKFRYGGQDMQLSEKAEEVAGFYSKMIGHEYTNNYVFNANFFRDWRQVMTAEERETIKDLKKCNFSALKYYYERKTEEQKADKKKKYEELKEQYGYCIIDGHIQKIGNFKVEPPGLFRGRGIHPRMGMLKKRVQPEDVTINIGKEAMVPDPPAGHKWKEVLHDNTVTWLASWEGNIFHSMKYVWLDPSSKLKGEEDWKKYETARELKNHISQVRETYSGNIKSKDMEVAQRAVAIYFIDKLALRAGNVKGSSTADTVGCCSLRVEHITLNEEKNGKRYVVDFNFLGKDSIRYKKSIPVEKPVFKNLELFMKDKQPYEKLFDRLNTLILNNFLKQFMEGLTAKVFRTYKASNTLQEQLRRLTGKDMSESEKIYAYKQANRKVALLCNHRRSIPDSFSETKEELKNEMEEKLRKIKYMKKKIELAKNSGSKKDKIKMAIKKRQLLCLEEEYKKLNDEAKEVNKGVSLGTSKLNYMDPRISVAWCKKWNVPIENIFTETQRQRFRWAIEMTGPNFQF